MYALIANNQIVEYPTSINAWRLANPTVSLPEAPTEQQLNDIGIFNVTAVPAPTVNTDQVAEKTIALVENVWSEVWTVRQCTEAELSAKQAALAAVARNQRNQILKDSDWTQVVDAPVDKIAWATYRQSLRDITKQESFPLSVTWPEKP